MQPRPKRKRNNKSKKQEILLNLPGTTPVKLTISPRAGTAHSPQLAAPRLIYSPAQRSSPDLVPTLGKLPQNHRDLEEEKKKDSVSQPTSLEFYLPANPGPWEISVQPLTSPSTIPETFPLFANGPAQPPQHTKPNPSAHTHKHSQHTRLYYKEQLHDLAYHLLLIALVSPNAMNAFCEPSGVKPDDLSLDWWNKQGTAIQVHSIVNALFSLGVNVYVQRDFIPQALKELRDSFKKCFTSTRDFMSNCLTLISSSAAALSFAAMSYQAFAALGKEASAAGGGASLCSSFATRYPNVKKATHKISLSFNSDMCFQKKMADRLRHLKPNFTKSLNKQILSQQLHLHNNKDLAHLLDNVGTATQGQRPHVLLSKKTAKEYLKEYSIFFIEVSFSTVTSSTAFFTFTQKGFDGANVIAHFMGYSLDHLSHPEQFAIGGIGGLVSASLYYIAALNFLPTFTYVCSELSTNVFHASKRLLFHPITTIKETIQAPQQCLQSLKMITCVAAVYFSGGAMDTVGRGMVAKKEKGIFWVLFSAWKGYAQLFPTLNKIGGITINLTSTINQAFKKEKEAARKEKRENPQLEDIANHLEEMLLPDKIKIANDGFPLTVKTLSHLKQFSLFKPAAPLLVADVELAPLNPLEEGENPQQPLLNSPDSEEQPARNACRNRVPLPCLIL